MANPCELAQQLGVSISQLWAFEVRDGQTNQMLNDFYLPRTRQLGQLLVAAKAKPRKRKPAKAKAAKPARRKK
jgi:hypothetical protein